ncbi:DMT family transporter [Sulfitobacter sp. M57]|uniref:DMT family transporter n=1 Tax=unclassified Sulfitobacter TaxID=196795 RepID=UPI0023E15FDF|nr:MULTISPECIES: DMT family transporter [unclassified Sulfitobacter]MDF3413676.1 DMT family transporter [Sulfitobacter sp. KE5]MDF3421043.1 DMT family transporter [Sulfitobacter sp. KE43]MDF3432222.1 DMT family transporter [Sulfitobacter sp. KE42]MDF3457861.1 DMT family transporter [Sulfitobacter sp. S74]MDF3461762.1 DMT family transporter [Sulfitobacter sp. Ks18]
MNSTVQAALWMIGAVVSFTAMAVAGRALSGEFDTFEIMMYRSALGLLVVVLIAVSTGCHREIGTASIRTHLIRNVFHFTGQNLWFFAVTIVPLAQVFALEFTTPLWVIVLSFLLLGEKLTKVRAIAAVMGFVGILIVARPSVEGMNAGILAAAGCAVFFALTYVFTKRLTRTETITSIMFYLTSIQLVLGVIAAGYDGDIAIPSAAALPWLVLVACCGLLAHFCITKALTIAPATVVAPIDFARLPLVAVAAMLLYNEAIDVWVFVGAVIIFAGNYLNIWFETRKTA